MLVVAHTLNLTIKDILTGDEFGELEELQVKVNAIIAHFNRSSISKEEADIHAAIRGYCCTRFLTYFGSLSCIGKLKSKIMHYFENVFPLKPQRQHRDVTDYNYGKELPAKLDLDTNDFCMIHLLLKYKKSFDRSIKRFSSVSTRIGDVFNVFSLLIAEVKDINSDLERLFTTMKHTEEGKKIGTFEENGHIPGLILSCIYKRWEDICENKIILGAHLIVGDRLFQSENVPEITDNMTSEYYTYLDHLKSSKILLEDADGHEMPSTTLYKRVIDHLVYMVQDLRFYNIGTQIEPSGEEIRRSIESWINMPLGEYINSKLIVKDGKFTKVVDWKRVRVINPIVSNLGCLY